MSLQTLPIEDALFILAFSFAIIVMFVSTIVGLSDVSLRNLGVAWVGSIFLDFGQSMNFGIKKLSLIGSGARIVFFFLIRFMKTCGYTQLLLIGNVSVSVCMRHF